MLLHNLQDCTFKTSFKLKSMEPMKTTLHLVCIKPDGWLYLPELIFLEQHLFAFCLLSPNLVQSMFSLRSLKTGKHQPTTSPSHTMTSLFMKSVASIYIVIFRVLSGCQMVTGRWMHHLPHSIIYSTNVDKRLYK